MIFSYNKESFFQNRVTLWSTNHHLTSKDLCVFKMCIPLFSSPKPSALTGSVYFMGKALYRSLLEDKHEESGAASFGAQMEWKLYSNSLVLSAEVLNDDAPFFINSVLRRLDDFVLTRECAIDMLRELSHEYLEALQDPLFSARRSMMEKLCEPLWLEGLEWWDEHCDVTRIPSTLQAYIPRGQVLHLIIGSHMDKEKILSEVKMPRFLEGSRTRAPEHSFSTGKSEEREFVINEDTSTPILFGIKMKINHISKRVYAMHLEWVLKDALRDKKGYVYGLDVRPLSHSILVSTICHHKNAREVLSLVERIIRGLAVQGIAEEEARKYQYNAYKEALIHNETTIEITHSICDMAIGRSLLEPTKDFRVEDIERFTIDDLYIR
jgi:hypothetical protein